MHWSFLLKALSIVLIDLILGGDNAVVIAMAVRALPRPQRIRGIAAGAGGAVVLRVAITFFAAQLLHSRFVQLIGGVLILWIALRLFADSAADETGITPYRTFWKAIGYIIIADITMSTDNILAIAAASKGNLGLLVFGLGLSIPFVVFTSSLLSMLMTRYPFVIYLGAAILGRVAGEMIMTDAVMARLLHPSELSLYCVEAVAAVGVVAAGRFLELRHRARSASGNSESKPTTAGQEMPLSAPKQH